MTYRGWRIMDMCFTIADIIASIPQLHQGFKDNMAKNVYITRELKHPRLWKWLYIQRGRHLSSILLFLYFTALIML